MRDLAKIKPIEVRLFSKGSKRNEMHRYPLFEDRSGEASRQEPRCLTMPNHVTQIGEDRETTTESLDDFVRDSMHELPQTKRKRKVSPQQTNKFRCSLHRKMVRLHPRPKSKEVYERNHT
jgi:hypothetical protein